MSKNLKQAVEILNANLRKRDWIDDAIDAKRDRKRAAELLSIAREHLGLTTLDARNSDATDFSDQACWAIKAALEAAFEAGRIAGGGK